MKSDDIIYGLSEISLYLSNIGREDFAQTIEDTCKIIDLLKEHEPKTGYWIESAGDDKCSVCGATYSDLYPDYHYTHYCPNCGAKMTGGEAG